jgi:hypothetical protein
MSRILLILFFISVKVLPQIDSSKTLSLPLNREVPSSFTPDSALLYSPIETKLTLPKPDYLLLGALATVYTGSIVGIHIYQNNSWWSGRKGSFRFINDWEYALWIDKMGHFFAPAILAHAFSVGLEASRVDYGTGIWISSAAALAFQLYVEVEDGFAIDWGFSPGDAIFDVAGAAYPVFQYYYPYLYNIQPRFSYYPAQLGKTGHNTGQKLIVVDDYEGQKFWLSFKINKMFGENFEKFWPKFLMLSVGYGVRNLDGRGGGYSDIYLALDFDYEAIPLYGSFWQMLKNSFSFIKFPMPAIRITNGVAFYGFCF